MRGGRGRGDEMRGDGESDGRERCGRERGDEGWGGDTGEGEEWREMKVTKER